MGYLICYAMYKMQEKCKKNAKVNFCSEYYSLVANMWKNKPIFFLIGYLSFMPKNNIKVLKHFVQ